jgi:thymidine kinase
MKEFVIIQGTMFSGKTTRLLSIIEKQEKNRYLVIKPKIDNRSSGIATHDGKSCEAVEIETAEQLLELVRSNEDINSIFIDEFQFFSEEVAHAVSKLAFEYNIYISGLQTDYRNNLFGHAHSLKYLATEIVYLRASCSKCSSRADFNCRVIQKTGDQVQVGGAGDYEPRCNLHYSNPDI